MVSASRKRRGLPGWSVETAVEVASPREEYCWLAVHRCLCGGVWALEQQSLIGREDSEIGVRMTDRVEVACDTCARKETFYFVVQYEGPL